MRTYRKNGRDWNKAKEEYEALKARIEANPESIDFHPHILNNKSLGYFYKYDLLVRFSQKLPESVNEDLIMSILNGKELLIHWENKLLETFFQKHPSSVGEGFALKVLTNEELNYERKYELLTILLNNHPEAITIEAIKAMLDTEHCEKEHLDIGSAEKNYIIQKFLVDHPEAITPELARVILADRELAKLNKYQLLNFCKEKYPEAVPKDVMAQAENYNYDKESAPKRLSRISIDNDSFVISRGNWLSGWPEDLNPDGSEAFITTVATHLSSINENPEHTRIIKEMMKEEEKKLEESAPPGVEGPSDQGVNLLGDGTEEPPEQEVEKDSGTDVAGDSGSYCCIQ